jgi:DNA-binding response OmpR family regulator
MPHASDPPDPAAHGRASKRLLVIDDDVDLCSLLARFLEREGLEAELAHDGVRGLEAALRGTHEAIVLDVMLPGLDGFEVLRRIRARKRTPILMLTARGDPDDRVSGLEMGADDYVAKPFEPRELLARIRAVLRRVEAPAGAPVESQLLVVGEVRVDLATREAWIGAEWLQLTPVELDLLVALMRSPGRLMSRDQLSRVALGRPLDATDRSSVDQHISNLRRKLGTDSEGASYIRTVRNAGYLLARPPAAGGP